MRREGDEDEGRGWRRARDEGRPNVSPRPKRASELLDRSSLGRWWVALAAIVRRGLVDKGHESGAIEAVFDDELARVISVATSRVLGEIVPMRLLELHEVKRIAYYCAMRIRTEDLKHEAYPEGWREDLRFIRGDEPTQAREPGEDDDE